MVKKNLPQKKREFSKNRVLLAGAITLLIFLIGIMFGMLLDNERYSRQNKQEEEQRLDYESLQLQYLYLSYIIDKNESCRALSKALEKTTSELGSLLDKVLSIKDQNPIRNPDYETLYRSYLQSNFRYWLLAEKASQKCGFDSVIILYFFSEKECPICPEQGVILTYFKKKYEDKILIFPVNIDFSIDEPFINLIISSHNVNELPAIVIGDDIYTGVVSKQDLQKILCEKNQKMCENK